jgi:hypothetical protein
MNIILSKEEPLKSFVQRNYIIWLWFKVTGFVVGVDVGYKQQKEGQDN